MKFTNLLSVITYFADKQKATEHLISLRWPNGVINCPHCGETKIYTLKGANKRFKCATCREQFSATKGTIFENSALPLQLWFAAIYLHTSHKKGISSHQLAKDLGITQKSAWFMLQRIRYALQSGTFTNTENDFLQVDETFVGGKEKNKHQSRLAKKDREKDGGKSYATVGRSLKNKKPVVGMMATGGMVVAQAVDNTKSKTLLSFINKHAKAGSTITTDEWIGYANLYKEHTHITVKHRLSQYTNNGFHTNGIENFWSHFKRTVYGTYHQVSDKHLDKYVDECEFRFNTRELSEINRFDKMLTLCNRRLTYNELISEHE